MKQAEVAIVGGGPAGAALAIRLARTGHEVVTFERLARPRWRASGVYSSPLTRRHLLALGLAPARVEQLIRPISAMVVRTASGAAECRLEYPAPERACGLDRVRLELALLERARAEGAQVCEGTTVREVDLAPARALLSVSGAAGPEVWQAELVVGADGPSSLVARAAAVARPSRQFRRAALTVHRHDPSLPPDGLPAEAEMIVGPGWYCGVAPVPGQRVNLGLVLGEKQLRRRLARDGDPPALLAALLGGLPGRDRPWLQSDATDDVQVCLPLAHRVARAGGRNFLLVGDAAGFVDPLSGEGLQRAFSSARLAARAIGELFDGNRRALDDYGRRLRRRYRAKDFVSWLLQLFLFNPPLAEQALGNLAWLPDHRRTFALALADMLPATRVLDPRFLAGVLAGRG